MVLSSVNALKVYELQLGAGFLIEYGHLLPSLLGVSAVNFSSKTR
jgi:hypothetical protein